MAEATEVIINQHRAEDKTLAELALGTVIVLFAIGLIQHHRESFRAQSSSKDNSGDCTWIVVQFRRRTIASSLIALTGVLFVADYFVENIWWSVIMVCVIVLLLPVIFILAMLDFYKTQQRLRPSIEQTIDARKALYDEADRMLVEQHRQKQSEHSRNKNDDSPNDNSRNDDRSRE